MQLQPPDPSSYMSVRQWDHTQDKHLFINVQLCCSAVNKQTSVFRGQNLSDGSGPTSPSRLT